jgi:hypothetical protein
MRVRRASLEEWFLDLQLRTVARDHFHIPFTVDVPVGELFAAWRDRGRVPTPAIVVRAVAALAVARPLLNRMLFRTPLGMRILEFDQVRVNVPVLTEHDGRRYVSAVVVDDAASRTVEAIHDQIREARRRPVTSLPINRLFVDGRDTILRRVRLLVTHQLAYHSPRAYAAGGGGALAVSSLHHRRHPHTHARGVALGPNALTALVLGVHGEGDDARLHLGIAFDHALLKGDEMGEAIEALGEIFADPAMHGLTPDTYV